MTDIYSLHTERDIEHQKELQLKQAEIYRLNKTNDELVAENKQLRYNIKLLLVSYLTIINLLSLIATNMCPIVLHSAIAYI